MSESRVRIPPETAAALRPLAEAAQRQGLPLYAVGGCVRDWLLGSKHVVDLDLVAEGDPAPLARLAGRLAGVKPEAFGEFGTWRVKGRELRVDFAASRQEVYPEPASLPKVSPAPLERDLFRRDFTINAMAVRLDGDAAGRLVDPYNGRGDLASGILRVLHPASFRDDPTRVFRAARFLCRFSLRPAPGFGRMVKESLYGCIAGRLSRHRIAAELLRILSEDDPSCALRRLKSWGYLDLVHPDARARVAGRGVEERLGFMALAMGKKGEEFLRSLPVERGLAQRILEALRAARRKASPRGRLPPESSRMLALAFPRLPKTALQPLFLSGDDLQAAGLEPGPEFRSLLDAAAKAQWQGRISSRGQALKWLGGRLRRR
ncbi:MAG TPA: hypothetical protein DEB40_01825 [Elusimicrobia bacterium]|nr:hypothetical protein [Elusimicrobiota bacterium]HBT60469.1 hypothetical protein [Elusimicrobiota bacterium]